MSRTIVLKAPGMGSCGGALGFLPGLTGRMPTKNLGKCPRPPAPCRAVAVVELDPEQGAAANSPNSSMIFFDRAPKTIDSFTVSVSGGPPNGNVPGSFTVAANGLSATFAASPPIASGQGGTATSTVVVDKDTDCEQTITWTWEIFAG